MFSKKILDGDTYAIKIINNDKLLDGKYFIFIKTSYNKNKNNKYIYFRVKITKNSKLPKTKKEIEKLEYVIVNYTPEELKYFPINTKLQYEDWVEKNKDFKTYPDEYGYLYTSLFSLNKLKYKDKNVFYLGNFSIKEPQKEFLSILNNKIEMFQFNKDLVNELCRRYHDYNLKEYNIYKEKNNKKIRENARNDIKIHKEIEKKVQIYLNNPHKFKKYKLYDSDLAKKIVEKYQRLQANYSNNNEFMNKIQEEVAPLLEDIYDKQIFWIILADLQLKNKKLDKQLKTIAMYCIEENLSFWIALPNAKKRKMELDKLTKQLLDYNC